MINKASRLPESLNTIQLPRIDSVKLRAKGMYPVSKVGSVDTRHGKLPIIVIPELMFPSMMVSGILRKRITGIAVPSEKHAIEVSNGYARISGGRK